MSKIISAKVFNYTSELRDYESNGVKYRHLGTIEYKNRKFIVYHVYATKENYIEELIDQKSDIINPSSVRFVDDDILWITLMNIAKKEGLIKDEDAGKFN
jgi:hypothetical protein